MQRIILVVTAILLVTLAPTGTGSTSARGPLTHAALLVAAIDLVSPTTGWVVLYSPRISHLGAECTYDLIRVPVTVVKTVDAGRHWATQLHFIGSSPVSVRGQWMHFVNARDGFISGPSTPEHSWLYRTRDGGKTWRRLALPGMPDAPIGVPFSFTSAQNGWLLADVGAAMGQSKANVFHTVDGGSRWVKVAYSEIVGRPGNLGAGGDKNAIVFRDATIGWITAPSPAGPGFVYRTSDGGVHWAGQLLNLPKHGMPRDTMGSEGYPSPPVIFNRSSGLLASEVHIGRPSSSRTVPVQGSPSQLLLYSLASDGVRWSNPHFLPGTGNSSHPMYWQLLDSRRWWVGTGNTLRRTSNAGRTWQASTLELPRGFIIRQLDFVDSDRGWTIADAGATAGYPPCASLLLRTSDAGARWKLVTSLPG